MEVVVVAKAHGSKSVICNNMCFPGAVSGGGGGLRGRSKKNCALRQASRQDLGLLYSDSQAK